MTSQMRKQHKVQHPVPAVVFGLLSGGACLAGASLEQNGYLSRPDAMHVVLFLVIWAAAGCAAALLWAAQDGRFRTSGGGRSLSGIPAFRSVRKRENYCSSTFSLRKRVLYRLRSLPTQKRRIVVWTSLCLVDLISLLAVYPGFFVYDAAEELAMVQSRTFTTHHPLVHVLLMGGIILAVHKITASWNAGIFIYILLQMMTVNLAFTYQLEDIRRRVESRTQMEDIRYRTGDRTGRREGGRLILLISFLWLAFCPTVTMFVLCSCKDGLFAAALLVMTIQLRRMLMEGDHFFAANRGGRRQRIRYLAAVALMMLLRNNGVYAYAVFVVIFAVAGGISAGRTVRRKAAERSSCAGSEGNNASDTGNLQEAEQKKAAGVRGRFLRSFLILLMPVLLFLIVSKGLAAAAHASSGERQEILTVPIMQLGRTWQASADTFTEDEKTLMAELMEPLHNETAETDEGTAGDARDYSGWSVYNPVLSDQLKLRFRSSVYDSRRSDFWKMYLHQFRLHPVTYLNAWLMTSYGFWYPEAVIDCYRGNTVYTFTYGNSSYFGYETELPGIRRSLLPWLDGWYRFLSLDARAQKIPVLHLFLSPGALAWVMIFLLFSLARKRDPAGSTGKCSAGKVGYFAAGSAELSESTGRPESADVPGRAAKTGCADVPGSIAKTDGADVPGTVSFGRRRLLLVYLPTFLVWLTVLLGPCTLPRYVVYLWFEFPLMLTELCS